MEGKSSIIFTAAILAFAAIRIYQKYFSKDAGKKTTGRQENRSSPFSQGKRDDDYEPYSGK